MGKISTKDSRGTHKHTPLAKDIAELEGSALPKSYKKTKTKHKRVDDEDDVNSLDAKASRKVLKMAREQQDEVEDENVLEHERTQYRIDVQDSEDSDEDAADDDDDLDEDEYYGEDDVEDEEMDARDVALFEAFFKGKKGNNVPFQPINLADKIMEKFNEMNQDKQEQPETAAHPQTEGVMLPPRVIEAYEKVGDALRAWTHGKLPKLFKVLPTIRNWEDLLYVTAPETWTPNAVYEATRLFVSNLNASKAERFVNLVVLPRFRDDIEQSEGHKLNYHLFRSLKKSLYKPQAFFKGFLFPLVEDHCTLREALIAASVLTKTSIPVQHASVALSWLLEQEYTPAATVFIRVLVEKKYALPYQTIDDLVFYFMRFRIVTDTQSASADADLMDVDEMDVDYNRKINRAPDLPIVWHKAFLSFAQRYKNDITEDQRDFLMETIRQRNHKHISPEIRRELLAGKAKQNAQDAQQNAQYQQQSKSQGFQQQQPVEDVMSYF